MATTKKGVAARQSREEGLDHPLMAQRAGWVLLAGIWLFVLIALLSYDSADAPSYVVAVHNDPPRNLCGTVGALVAHWLYHVLGGGVWVLLAGLAGFLGVTVTGRQVTHPFVRFVGLLLMVLAVSSFQRLLFPQLGPLAGAPGGLLAEYVVGELAPRFSVVGTGLILLAVISLGAMVAIDEIVMTIPRVCARLWAMTAAARETLQNMQIRPEKAEPAVASAKATKSRSKRRSNAGGPIDLDAGGVGATEAFDPEEYEVVDEEEPADEEEEEYEYEDEDEEYEEEEDPDAEYEEEEDPDAEYEDEDGEYEDDEEYEDEDDEEEDERRELTEEELREKIAMLPLRMSGSDKKIARDEDIPRQENFEGYQFPMLELLEDPETNFNERMEEYVREQAKELETALHTYGIDGEVTGIESGPVVTQYSVQLAPGTKVAKLNAISSDLARSLSSQNVRIVPNTPGKTTVGIEVPNIDKEKVRLKELMSGGQSSGMHLPMFLGKDASGEPLVGDLARMPHMLIAGTTGSGKSVCMNTIIMSWLYTKRPDELKLVLVDPKMVELGQFSDIPHLMCPVVTEMSRAAAILEWAVGKMEERYELLKEAGVRDIGTYNGMSEEDLYERFEPQNEEEKARIPKRLPFIVFVIDELADLILTHKEVEQHIVRIAQKARAVGIHLILATQRPQANVVTGLIKSNMPCRVSFKVASGMDSRIVLDQKGAELLLGQGDMLYLSPHTSELRRAQGTLVTDTEIRKVAKFLRTVAGPTFERSLIAIRPGADDDDDEIVGKISERDPLFEKAVDVMIESGRGSVSLLQRRLAIGYSRASRLVDQMSMAGILGDHRGSVARDVLISQDEWERMKQMVEEDEQAQNADQPADESDHAADDAEDEPIPEVETFVDEDVKKAS